MPVMATAAGTQDESAPEDHGDNENDAGQGDDHGRKPKWPSTSVPPVPPVGRFGGCTRLLSCGCRLSRMFRFSHRSQHAPQSQECAVRMRRRDRLLGERVVDIVERGANLDPDQQLTAGVMFDVPEGTQPRQIVLKEMRPRQQPTARQSLRNGGQRVVRKRVIRNVKSQRIMHQPPLWQFDRRGPRDDPNRERRFWDWSTWREMGLAASQSAAGA